MRRALRQLVPFAIAVALACGVTTSGRQPWTALFDGRDLDGWEVVSTGRWTVEDGAIVMRRLPGDRSGGWLYTKADYGDFILRLKFKPDAATFHTGILVRDPGHGKIGRPGYNGYEISMAQGIRGENTNGAIYYLGNAYIKNIPAHEWASIEIHCVGDHITTYLNGEKMAETHTRRSFRGGIGLHLHGGDFQPEYKWKDIEIQELPPAAHEYQLAEEKVAQSAGESAPLFESMPVPSGWTLQDRILRAADSASESTFATKATYTDFLLSFDFRLSSNGVAGVLLRMPDEKTSGLEVRLSDSDDGNPSGSIVSLARAFKLNSCEERIYRPGQWNQARIYVLGDHIVTFVNQNKTADVHSSRFARGPIGFRVQPHTVADFRNVTIKRVGP